MSRLHGNSGTIKVDQGQFTTLVTGRIELPQGGHLFAVSLIAGAQGMTPFSVTTAVHIGDPGVEITVRMNDLCGDISGDPTYSQSTDGLDWTGWLPLGSIINDITFLINNDSETFIKMIWGWASSDD